MGCHWCNHVQTHIIHTHTVATTMETQNSCDSLWSRRFVRFKNSPKNDTMKPTRMNRIVPVMSGVGNAILRRADCPQRWTAGYGLSARWAAGCKRH